jgi:hypothetical protein
MTTFDGLANRMMSDPQSSLGVGANEEEIEHAARVLMVPIAGGYRRFLRRFGWGGAFGDELYGLGANVPPGLDLVLITESERTAMYPPLPTHLLPVMNNGGGDLVCLDTRASLDEPPVVMWWHEDGPDQVPEAHASDFLSWLATLLVERATGSQRA